MLYILYSLWRSIAYIGRTEINHKMGEVMNTEQFEFEGMKAGYVRSGKGQQPVLSHGSGLGASSVGNWKSALGALTLASRNKRFATVLTTGAMGTEFRLVEETRRTWTCP